MSFKKIANIIEEMHSNNIEIPQDIKDIYLDYKYISKNAQENSEKSNESSSEDDAESEMEYTHSDIIDLIINTTFHEVGR